MLDYRDAEGRVGVTLSEPGGLLKTSAGDGALREGLLPGPGVVTYGDLALRLGDNGTV